MPVCEKCNSKWGWKETIKKMTTLDPAINCPYCKEIQYQTQRSKWKSSFLNLIILLPLLLNLLFHIPGIIILSLIPILFLLIISLYPFLVELSSKEKYFNLFKNNS